MATLKNVITELDKLFAVLNLRYFDNSLVKPVIIVQSNGKNANVLGHCSTRRVWADTAKMEEYFEISISAEYLYRPFVEIAETLLHEMAHLSNLLAGVQDCSRGGFYHNKKFKVTAERVGLVVAFSDKYGWAFTKPTEETVKFLESVSVDRDEFSLTRKTLHRLIPVDDGGGRADGGPQDSKPIRRGGYRKYICPQCLMVVRATKNVNVKCGDCDMVMVKEGA